MVHLLGILILGTVKVAAGAAVLWFLLKLLGLWRKLLNSWKFPKSANIVGPAGCPTGRRGFLTEMSGGKSYPQESSDVYLHLIRIQV